MAGTPFFVPLADRAALRAKVAQYDGFRYATFAKQTGGLVIVVHGVDAGLESEGDPAAPKWFSCCETHDTLVGHDTLALAKAHASDPCGWCEECRTATEEAT